MARRRLRLIALWIVVVWGLAGCALAKPISAHKTIAQNGGLRVTVQLTCSAGQQCAQGAALMQALAALQQRAQIGLGVRDATDKALSAAQIEIDLPGYTNQQAAVSALTSQGLVQFIDANGVGLDVGTKVTANQYPVLFTGAQLDPKSISTILDQNNQIVVLFEFQRSVSAQFAAYTRNNQGDYLTITVDNVVIESAQIQSEIDGQAEISGFKSMANAQALAAELKTSPLPTPLTLVNAQLIIASDA